MQVHHLRRDELPGLPTVAALGTFDGVHLGHREVLDRTVAEARDRGIDSAAVTFDLHPAQVLRPESAPKLLTSFDEKLDLIADCQIDRTFVVGFDEAEAERAAGEFVETVLLGQVGAVALVVGHNLHFGHRRVGNVDFLRSMGTDIEVISVDPVKESFADLEAVSSTAIRRALRGGEVAHAARMLGRPYSVKGEVIHGDHRGRTIGFPTANLRVAEERAWPSEGVYVGWFEQPSGSTHPCAINLGRRPTFHQHAQHSLIEAHLLDFDDDLYGQVCKVAFVEFLRSELRFDGIDALVAQLKEDVGAARVVLGV